METTKRIIILLIPVFLMTSPAQSMDKTAEVLGTRVASCLVKITCDKAVLVLNLDTVNYLLHSSGVDGKAAHDTLNISPDQAFDFFSIEYVDLGVSGGLGGVGILPSPSRTGRSGISDYGSEMLAYEEMIEMERPDVYNSYQVTSTNSTKSGSSSSVVRSTSRSQPGTGISSSARRTTTSITRPATSTSYSRRGRAGDLYGEATTSTAPRKHIGTTAADTTDKQTFLFSLNIHLPEEVKPLAREFMNALVENLRQVLTDAYDGYEKEIHNMLQFAETRRDRAQSQLAKAMEQAKATSPGPEIRLNPADAAVYERLEQIVDLPDLTISTAFADVLEKLGKSVNPPLQIQPNWKDLLENGEVEQTTPAGMDPLTGIKLRKALEILLAGVSGDVAELKYVVDEGVILIATEDTLPSKMFPVIYEIPALAYSAGRAKDLIDTIRNTIEPDSWFDISDTGEASITPFPSQEPRKLAILQTYEVHQKIEKFLESIKIDIPAGMPLEVPEEVLLSEKNNLLVEQQNLEMELARLEGRMPAIEEQIVRIKKDIDQRVNNDQVSKELRSILAMQVKYLEGVKKLVNNGSMSSSELADAEEKLARAKIELAMRREQIGASAGADQLAKFTNELATLAIDMAEKKAMLGIVSNQLNRTDQQLTASSTLDPQVSQIRLAARALEIAEKRVNELNTLALNVQPPTVSVLGAK